MVSKPRKLVRAERTAQAGPVCRVCRRRKKIGTIKIEDWVNGTRTSFVCSDCSPKGR